VHAAVDVTHKRQYHAENDLLHRRAQHSKSTNMKKLLSIALPQLPRHAPRQVSV
jgi:hypothetical protein